MTHDQPSPSLAFIRSTYRISRDSSALIAPSVAGFTVCWPAYRVRSPRTAAHHANMLLTASVKFFRSPAWNCCTRASGDVSALIFVMYDSHTGTGLPSRSWKSFAETPEMNQLG